MAADRNSALFWVIFRVLFFVLLSAAGLSGCGKTGPLYLPDTQFMAPTITLVAGKSYR